MTSLMLLVIGLCAGSFVNALVWRIHEQSTGSKKIKLKERKDLSILKGRSMCPNCHHVLAWYDLVPVFSWLLLRGKCRYCHKSIPIQYPVVEISVALLFLLSYSQWAQPFNFGNTITLSLWLITLTGLVALFIYDLKWMLLPNRIMFPLFIPAALYAVVNITNSTNSFLSSILNLVGPLLVLGGLFWLLYQISKGAWIGGGDVKLGFLLALVIGALDHSILALFLASLIGTVVAVPLLISHNAKASSKLPFGPFLIASTIVVVLYGTQIINWYNHIILLSS